MRVRRVKKSEVVVDDETVSALLFGEEPAPPPRRRKKVATVDRSTVPLRRRKLKRRKVERVEEEEADVDEFLRDAPAEDAQDEDDDMAGFLDDEDDEPASERRPKRAEKDHAPSPTSTLNPEQLAAVAHDDGPIVLQAVAGCGKTHVVCSRVVRLVKERRIPGERILAVTFSKKAAMEMTSRIKRMGVTSARVGTWHSLSLQILKEDVTRWSDWKVDDRNKFKTCVKEAVGFRHVDWKGVDVGKVMRCIGMCKANLWHVNSPEALDYATRQFGHHNAQNFLDTYSIVDNLMATEGILAFDNFLVFVHQWLTTAFNRDTWAQKWDYVIIDEYQDNNFAQDAIAELLVRDHKNLMVVGDCAQSIFGFRGSSPSFIVDFEKKWPGAKRIAMVRNYRSGRKIIQAANAVIAPAAVRMPEEMVAERDLEGVVRAMRVPTFDAEGAEIVSWARDHLHNGGTLSDLTVLFRTNAQSRAIEEALLKAKLPYVLVGGHSFYERKEVKDLLAYLRVAVKRDDKESDGVRRSINAPFRYLGKAFVERVMRISEEDPLLTDWPMIVRKAAAQAGVQDRQTGSAEDWANIIEKIREMTTPSLHVDPETKVEEMREDRADVVLNWIVNRTQYIKAVEHEEGVETTTEAAASNVRELIRVASEFATVKSLLEYIEKTLKAANKQRKDDQAGGDRVLLMNIHRSKGLEWPKVWMVGCNEKILPHAKGDPEEERRLMYVGVTRARDELVMSYVAEFAARSGIQQGEPSIFLKDMAAKGVIDLDGFTVDRSTVAREIDAKLGSAALLFPPQFEPLPGGR